MRAAQSPDRVKRVSSATPLYSLPDPNGWLSRDPGGCRPPAIPPGEKARHTKDQEGKEMVKECAGVAAVGDEKIVPDRPDRRPAPTARS